MIDDAKQDRATQYVLGELDEQESARFQEELAHDDDLQRFISEMHETAAEMALAANPRTPRPQVLERILDQIRPDSADERLGAGSAGIRPEFVKRKVLRLSLNWLPWTLAASLAIACALLAIDRGRLGREITALREQDALSQMRIATLTAQAEAYAKVLAVVVWDEKKQRGIVTLDRLARPEANHDYQLWVIDPSRATPVSAGVVTVKDGGLTRAVFKPAQVIRSASKFAVSIERKGGAPSPEGPIILVSN